MIVSMLRKPGNICCGHKMFLKEIRNIFVSRTQILCQQQMLRARANGETFVSATMCPQHCVLVCHRLKKSDMTRIEANVMHALHDWHHIVSILVKVHQNTHSFVKHEEHNSICIQFQSRTYSI